MSETLERERTNLCVQFNEVRNMHNELLVIPGADLDLDKDFYTNICLMNTQV